MHRNVRMAIALSTCVLTVVVAAARCYPANTRVVVFIEGVYSAYDPAARQQAYDGLIDAFTKSGYAPERLLYFSYAGGEVSADRVWHPNPHECSVTDRAATGNLAVLESMLVEYRARHPDAHFTLVGHSLGGYLAFLEGAREAERLPEQSLAIDTVVTLDAPLLGVSPDKKIALDAVGCTKTYIAAAEIVADKLNPAIADERAAEVAAMHAAGIRLATLGSTADCLYNLGRCVLSNQYVDDSQTQFLESADLVRRYDATTSAFRSHFMILTHPAAIADIVTFTGSP